MHDRESPSDSEAISESSDVSFLSRNKRRLRLAAVGCGLLLLLSGALWFLLTDDGPSPLEMQQEALDRLEDRDSLQARNHAARLAKLLEAVKFRDAEFPGAIEYILGIATFRDAQEMGEVGREQRYRLAVRYLEEARLQAVDRPELAYALGVSLYQLGHYSAAREELEHAVETFAPGRVDASLRLQDIYLNSKDDHLLQEALALNSRLLDDATLEPVRRDDIYLQRAQLQMALGLNADAMQALGNLTEESSRKQSTQVFHAQVLMTKADKVLAGGLSATTAGPPPEHVKALLEEAKRDYEQSVALLKPVADAFGLERPQARRAAFLIAVSHERIGDIHTALFDDSTRKNYDLAIASYERAAEKYETSHEGVAANLRAAELLRRETRHEEALKAYKRALQSVGRSEDFSNRWLTLKDFQSVIGDAWKDWIEQHLFETAIELSKRMVPLFPPVTAYRFTAEANQRWAEYLDHEFQHTRYGQREPLEQELRERWRMSGQAYADLAHELRTSSEYPEALWTSAQHFRNGHDFEKAFMQLIAFIGTRPTERLPLAEVRLGEILLDLDRPADALQQFEGVAAEYPTELAAFEARYLAGVAQLELNQLEQAEKTWRDILTSGELTPAAVEWRKSLFSLGSLLYHRAAASAGQAKVESADSGSEALDAELRMWHDAARCLEEFLKRYADDSDAFEVRYLLAKSLQRSADVYQRKLEIAETENARQELNRSLRALLDQAKSELLALQNELLELDAADMLDEVGQRMLRECCFETAHTYFALGMFEEAIVRYGGAANRYPDDPQVLLAYMQMSTCNDRLGKADEARSMLEQARIIHRGMLDAAFEPQLTNMNKKDWSGWIEWARRLHQAEVDEQFAEAEPGT